MIRAIRIEHFDMPGHISSESVVWFEQSNPKLADRRSLVRYPFRTTTQYQKMRDWLCENCTGWFDIVDNRKIIFQNCSDGTLCYLAFS